MSSLSCSEWCAKFLPSRTSCKRCYFFTPQDQLSTAIFGGVLGTQRLGSVTVNAALLGQAIPFATPGKADVWAASAGLPLNGARAT